MQTATNENCAFTDESKELVQHPYKHCSSLLYGLICHALIPHTKPTSKLVSARAESKLMYPNRIAIH